MFEVGHSKEKKHLFEIGSLIIFSFLSVFNNKRTIEILCQFLDVAERISVSMLITD